MYLKLFLVKSRGKDSFSPKTKQLSKENSERRSKLGKDGELLSSH